MKKSTHRKKKRSSVKKKTAKRRIASKKKVVKKKTTKRRATAKKKVSKKKSAKRRIASKKRVVKKKTTKKRATTKKKVSKKKTAKRRIASKKRVVKKKTTKKRATTKKRVVKKKASSKKLTVSPSKSRTKQRTTGARLVKQTGTPKTTRYKTHGNVYMNDQQLKYFYDILIARKEELMVEAGRMMEHMKSDSSKYADSADRATQEEEFTLELRERDRERKLMQKIDEALVKISNKEYGYCVSCGVEIGISRLEARPTTDQCIDCKMLDEITERHTV